MTDYQAFCLARIDELLEDCNQYADGFGCKGLVASINIVRASVIATIDDPEIGHTAMHIIADKLSSMVEELEREAP